MQRFLLNVSTSNASLRQAVSVSSATRALAPPVHAGHSRSSRTHCSSTATASRSSEPSVDRSQTKLTPKEVDEALRAAEQLLDSIVAGGGAPTMASVELGYTEYTDFEFACDESGCVLAVQQQDSKHAQSTPTLTTLISGADWSLGMLPVTTPSQTRFEAYLPTSSSDTADYQLSSSSSNTSPYSCVASGPGWHVALETAELSELVHMLVQLRMAVASLQYQGLWRAGKEERPPSRAKWESEGLGLTAVYCPGEPGFCVELRFSAQGRDMRMSWPPEVAAAVITAFDNEMGLRPLAARGT